jgi:hypothetical protein
VTLAPVSLEEIRAHLNITESDGHGDDEELWRSVLAATRMVESHTGAIRPRQVTERLSLTCPYDGYGPLPLSQWPLFGDTPPVVVSATSNWASRYAYDATYTVGRDPIPEDLMQAVLLQAGLLWASQRGPEASSRFTALGGDGIASPAGVDRRRLEDILSLYRVPAFA